MPRFVLEIGTEEIPPRFFPPALSQLRLDGETMLQRARLVHGEVKVYGAPRRLALVVEEVAAAQARSVREERGPAAKVAFDAEGKPTRAALGFAKRHGVSPESLERRQTDQGEYVFATIQEPEAPAKYALAALLPDLIAGLSFPKSMRWGTGSLRFGRPIRWLLALLDAEVVDFTLGELHSGRLTRGHPVLADGMFEVASAGEYEGVLEGRCVTVDQNERRSAIERWLDREAQAASARVVDGGLIEETTFLVEYPTAATGRFDPAYLSLPRPVLVEEMQHVQSYFPLEDESGALLPRFIAFRDGGDEHLDIVIAGWESVLKAKLIDASYFYQQDLKRPLADRVENLRGVVFQESLGSMYEKMERIRTIASALADMAGISSAERSALDRAALLCKADLTTDVVSELTSLQGLMGREYALASGESPEVAEAIGAHYRPRFAGDGIPPTKIGRLLAVADKIDTITACFAIGQVPTGSADPYGLRREASGVVSILLGAGSDPDPSQRISISLSRAIEAALGALSDEAEVRRGRDEVAREAEGFLQQRLETQLRDDGIRYDLVQAALAVGVDDVSAAADRASLLQALQAPEYDALPTIIASTRVSNIAKGFAGGQVDPSLFQDESERALWDACQYVLGEANDKPLLAQFLLLKRLRDPIDRFFEEVLVMAEEEKVRNNRLALCWQINQLFRRLADFTLVVQA